VRKIFEFYYWSQKATVLNTQLFTQCLSFCT